MEPCADTLCEICGVDYDFSLPAEILSAAKSRDLILFLGAGISTEGPSVTPSGNFYQNIAAKLHSPPARDAPFPTVMETFQKENSRKALIEQIFLRLKEVEGFRNSLYHATRFFDELATMPYIDTIFTTNWDTYVEDLCGATPFISGEDVALWDVAERKVLKLHGSIANLGSIVATEEDYQKNFEKLSKGFLLSLIHISEPTRRS